MLNSMTGFASKELKISALGKVSIDLRSSNHKFLEIVFHLPEALLFLEDRIKKEIEGKIKRGRVTCVINVSGGETPSVVINKRLLKNYILAIRNIKAQFCIKDEVGMETLIHLPDVLSLAENKVSKDRLWPRLKILVNQALAYLVRTRQKEGRALYFYLKAKADALKADLLAIKARFKKAIKVKIAKLNTDEERANFLKDMDITEEIERLDFHIRNFQNKILKTGPMGKELDFICQEMQREANTMGAKSFDVAVSSRVVQIKSQIEKIREQLQNIE